MDAAKLVERYLDTWNETDPDARGSAVASMWAEDSRYVDPWRASWAATRSPL